MFKIVKFSNWMNELDFNQFGAMDSNFLFAICAKAKEKGGEEIRFSFNELREAVDYRNAGDADFVRDLVRMNKKLLAIDCTMLDDKTGKLHQFNLFSDFVTDPKEKTLTVTVNEKYRFVLNGLTQNFTKFELEQFVELNSKYSKTLYRLLKQWRTVGKRTFTVEELHERLGVPESKTYTTGRIFQLIIEPACKELRTKKCFDNLRIRTNRAPGRGRRVISYAFTWKPEIIETKESEKDNTTKAIYTKTDNPVQEVTCNEDRLPWERDDIPDSDEAPYVSAEEPHDSYDNAAYDVDDELLLPNDFGIDDEPVAPVKPSVKEEEKHTGFHHPYYNDPSWSFS